MKKSLDFSFFLSVLKQPGNPGFSLVISKKPGRFVSKTNHMKATNYLTTFFEEKKIDYEVFSIQDNQGLSHYLDTDIVIEAIHNSSMREQFIISQTLRKLDFYNKNINDYLKHLGECLVRQ